MHEIAKRAYDVCFSGLGLLVLAPLLAVIALAIKVLDSGSVFFQQERVGRNGRLFRICKFRTMVRNAETLGLSVTKDRDPRITPIGRWLRKTKLDELPQLWNVIKGDMSLVGPRPEVPKYVARYTPQQHKVLELKPGITDLATLEFRDEEELLSQASDTEKFYVDYCIPRKVELNLAYAQNAGVWEDTKVILRTLFPSLPFKNKAEHSSLKTIDSDSS